MEEIFLPVVGYEGFYEVSNYGNVKNRKGKILKKHLFCKQCPHYDVRLYKDGDEGICIPIHRLVAMAFIPNPDNLPCVDHLDCNGLNNIVTNLRWCTQKENCNNPITLKRKKEANKNNMKPILQYTLDDKFVKEWESVIEATRFYNAGSGIWNCLNGRAKTCKSFIWKYKEVAD